MIEESLSRTIRKVTDNIEILMNGGQLISKNKTIYTPVEIVLEDENKKWTGFPFKNLAKLEEYVEPKTAREIQLEKQIAELQAEKAAGFNKKNKAKNTLSTEEQVGVASRWKADQRNEKPMTKIAFSEQEDISHGYLNTILVKFTDHVPRKKKVTPTSEKK